MRRRTLPEKVAIAVTLLASACASDHRVSPWGGQPGPTLSPFAPRRDLDARLAAIDAETKAQRLSRTFELRVTMARGAGPAVIRGYEGADAAGRAVHATRVASELGVVMAVGPLDVTDLDRRQATAIVPALLGARTKGEAGAFRSGTDLNGDGLLDVVLRSESGGIAIWHFDGLGSGAYEIAMVIPPSRGEDLDGDGRVDLVGELPPSAGDLIAPRFTDVGTFEEGRYRSSRVWHRGRARASISPAGAKEDARLKAVLERAFHTIAGGAEPAKNVLEALRREPVKGPLAASFTAHVGTIAALPVIR